MKELLKIAEMARTVVEVQYMDLQKKEVKGLEHVIPAIQGDVEALNEKAEA